MKYILEGKITEKEYLDASFFILFQIRRIFILLISAVMIFFVTRYLLKFDLYSFFGLILFCIVFFTLLVFALIPYRLKKNFRNSKKWNLNRKWIIDDEHIEMITVDSTNKFTWDEFTKYLRTKNNILLGLKAPKGMFHIIPSRIITESGKEEIFNFIHNHIK
jgi:hypothetical protein